MWRKNIVKQLCINRFNNWLKVSKKRMLAAATIQALFRMNHQRVYLKKWKKRDSNGTKIMEIKKN